MFYTTEIVMPSGIINNGDNFNVCVKDKDNAMLAKGYLLTNSEENRAEEITINI